MKILSNIIEKKILPLHKIRINAWPDECFLFSVVQNCSTGYDWIMNYFVQITTNKESKYSRRVNFMPSSKHHYKINAYDFCPFIVKHKISKKMFNTLEIKLSDVLIWAISQNYYVSVKLKQSFRILEHEKDINHSNYFYGYDMNRKIFYAADNFQNGKFAYLEISIDDVNNAYIETRESYYIADNEIYFYELVEYKHAFDVSNLIQQLEDYVSSMDRTGYEFSSEEVSYYGLQCYQILIEYIDFIEKTNQKYIDLRSFAFLVNHRELMKDRIEYLNKKKILIKCSELNLELDEQIVISKRILSLCLKYNLSFNNKYFIKIRELLRELCVRDEQSTKELILELKCFIS